MGLQLQSMAIEMPPVARHPNRIPFAGVLTLIDTPSDQAPSGARGHRVLLTKAATDRALPSLLGMALDYAPTLDRHDARRKVGIITSAEVLPGSPVRPTQPTTGCVGQPQQTSLLQISGYMFAKDFPEIVREIRTRGRAALGMSYEIADAHVDDPKARHMDRIGLHVYRSGDLAARESGVSGDVDRNKWSSVLSSQHSVAADKRLAVGRMLSADC